MSDDAAPFDPRAPLPAPPNPWRGSDTPSHRARPPYHMTDMIAAEPHLARRLLARLGEPGDPAESLAEAVRTALAGDQPVVLTGCGTSEHAAIGAAEILRWAAAGSRAGAPAAITAAQAFELALDPPRVGLVIGVSHEGGTAATNESLEAARAAGSRTALITATERSPGAAHADVVVATGEMDQSWCHTVGYVSPLLAATAVADRLTGTTTDPEAVAALMVASSADEEAAEMIADRLADAEHLLVVGSGVDRGASRELVLKIEEASWLPSAHRDLETLLHGHLPAADERTGMVLILTEAAALDRRARRARQALEAADRLGVRVAAILSEAADRVVPAGLTPAGRLVVPDPGSIPPPVASLLGSAMALQLLTERLARARGANPDPIRRDDPRYLAAAEAAGN